jgi:hypothetical protein
MKQGPISATYIKMFTQCLQKYYFRYHTDKQAIISGEHRPFGIAVHASLEAMYNRLNGTGRKPSSDDYEYVYGVFIDKGIKNKLSDQSLYEEGKQIMKKRLDSYDPSEKVIGSEIRFGFPYNNPVIPASTLGGTPLNGAIDKVVELDKDTLIVVDYKTSRTALTDEEAAKDEQLSLYDLVISRMYPQYSNIIIVLDYLRLSPVITHRTEEQRKLFERFVDSLYKQVGELTENDIKPMLNEFCGWCDYRHYCPLYQKVVTDPDLLIKPFEEMSEGEFVDEWVRFGNMRKMVDTYKRDLDMYASNAIRERRVSEIKGEEYTLYRVQQSRVSYDTPTIINLLPKSDLVGMTNINKNALDKWLLDHPEHASAISDTASVSFASSFFRSRKNTNRAKGK